MKKCFLSLLLTVLFCFLFIPLFAQVENAIHFSKGNFKAGNNILSKEFKTESLQPAQFGDKYFVLLQFSSIPSGKLMEELNDAGVQLNNYLPGKAYLASIKNGFDFKAAKKFNIISINALPVEYKLDPALDNLQQSYDKLNTRYIAVSYYNSINKETIQQEMQKLGVSIVPTKFNPANVIFVQADKAQAKVISALPFVSYVSLQTMKDKPLNYNDVATHGVSGLNAQGGKNLTGRGVTIGVGDNADISTHIDFAGRLIIRTPWYPDDHGTHVSGTAAGAGIIDVKNHGMAPHAVIINQLFSDIITNAATYITDNNLVLTNNSYYSVDAGCPGEGQYDVFSNYVDWQIKNYDQLLHVIASGNDGGLTCSPYPGSFGTVKSGWQCAKNVLTVGAIQTQDYSNAYFSSRGPVQDGRLKPEIVTGGWAVLSTNAHNTYGINYGTSMACPVATGSLTLMYERYRQLHSGNNPKSALMKAILCNTTEDLGNPGPDYTFGFGMLNARRAVQAIDSNWYFLNSIADGATTTHTIVLRKNARRLRVMLYWADKEAAINAANTLVNDLDLTVTEPSSIIHQPFILDPLPANVNNVAVEGRDSINNIEQVIIENPVAGSYTVNVNGHLIPYGPQDYAVTYEVLDSSVFVEYPFGGETWVPGETENIRWSAYGSESNKFTIEYSGDNGSSWTLIDNNVPATSRTYPWLVPTAITNKGLIRITRNGTNLKGQSNFNFTILDRPVVTATNVCEGYVQLDWGAISSATSYDIMQLVADSMQVIANTNSTSYLVKGLNKYNSYWFGVRAKNGTAAGRRSLSVNAIPSGGACTLPVFNNDIKVDSILEPNTARRFFSNAFDAIKPVKVRIKNIGPATVTGPFTVSYKYSGGSATETVNASINAGATYDYTFTTPYILNSYGFRYNFQAWATKSSDANHQNDTAFKTSNYLANSAIVTLPYNEGFETTDSAVYQSSIVGVNGNDAFDFSSNTINGRARSKVNTGFARTGKRAMTLDQSPYETYNTTDSLTATYNLSNYPLNQLRYDFYYKNQGQASLPGNKIWIRGSEHDAWLQAYDLYANQAELGLWAHGNFNINDVLNSASPAQTVSPTFQIRFGEEGFTSANTPLPLIDEDDGYTFDDLTLAEAVNDIALTQVISPVKGGCGLTANNPVTLQVKNYSNAVANNVQVSYQVNNGSIVTEIIPSIAANSSVNYTFNQTADLSAYIDYNINTWIKSIGDNYPTNDSILNYAVHNSPVISSYPYLQGFEDSDGYFYAKGINSSWQWGAPNKSVINHAANGNKVWATNLTGNYNNNENSYLYSPCFDLSSLAHPMLSFSHAFEVEKDFDYTWVEYSTDGINWQKLGTSGSGTNWYDNAVAQNWRLSDTSWHVASIDIPSNGPSVRFRFVLSSDGGVTYDGVGIDDIHIFDKADIYTGTPITANAQNVSGHNWIDFTSAGKKIVSINPNGTDLGLTNVEVYPNNGPVRNSFNQYYLNRNIVIHPFNSPAGNVSIRFYFTDSEAINLVNANSCPVCSKPANAYDLGVSKYSGSVSDENGTISDDIMGFFNYIAPDSTAIIPYNTGYYAEFQVHSFSEFWLNTGGYSSATPLPLSLISFTASKQYTNAFLQWSTENELNINKFIIERSSDGKNYTSIGYVFANDQSGVNKYTFTDTLPLQGNNYYRIEIIDRNGSITYSAARQLNFENNTDRFIVYPNPVKDSKIFVASSENCTSAVLLDASGKLIRAYWMQGKNNTLNIIGIAKGVYELKIFTDKSVDTEKILVQ